MQNTIEFILQKSLEQIKQTFPDLIMATLVLIVGVVLGNIISFFVKKFLKLLKLEKFLESLELRTTFMGKDTSELIALSIKLYVYLIFLSLSISTITQIKLIQQDLMGKIVLDWAPRFFQAGTLLIIGIFLGEHISKRIAKIELPYARLVGLIANAIFVYFVIALTLPLILGVTNNSLLTIVLSLPLLVVLASFSFGISIALGLAIGLGLKDGIRDITEEYLALRKRDQLKKYRTLAPNE